MGTVSVTNAKADWEHIVSQVAAGGTIIITRWGRPYAQLRPFDIAAKTPNAEQRPENSP